MTKKSRAFSLIELSIVILIIGILIAGVTQSSRLLRMAKLTTAQTLTKSSPVAGISGLISWFEPTLEGAFASSVGAFPSSSLFFQDAFAASFPSSTSIDDGDKVVQWTDINPQSSSKYYFNYITSSSDYYADYVEKNGPNGLPSLYFENVSNGPGFYLSNSEVTIGGSTTAMPLDAVTFFVVYMAGSENSYLDIWNYNSAGSGWDYYIGEGTPLLRRVYVNDPWDAGTVTTSSPEIAVMTLNTASNLNLYINGLSRITNQATTKDGCCNDSGIVGTDVYLSEIIIFDRVLKTEERQSVEAYLGKKYGIKVSSGAASSS
jgi:prepilin-type N-terminal cleavage/methylation domain-containing protein